MDAGRGKPERKARGAIGDQALLELPALAHRGSERTRRAGRLPFVGPLFRATLGDPGIMEGRVASATLRREAIYRRTLAAADLASATFALVLALALVGEGALISPLLFTVPLVVLASKAVGLYDRDQHLLDKRTLDEAPALLQVATVYAFVFFLAEDAFGEGRLGHEEALWLLGILFASMTFARAVSRRAVRAVVPAERCLVLGDRSDADWLGQKLHASPRVKVAILGCVPLEPGLPEAGDASVLGKLADLADVLHECGVDRVIIAPGASDSDQILDAIRLVKAAGVNVSVLPRLFEVVGSTVEFDDIEGVTLLGVRRHGLNRSSRALKRAMDLAGAGLALALLAPLLSMIAVAIRLETPGPALFRQRRMGRDDIGFDMLKFRTMVDDADEQKANLRHRNEAEGLFKIAEDPRVTRVGRFLRRASLDELPQLVNVLRGEMSLVGPRPLVIEEDRQLEGWDRHRLLLSPGMTGLWQIFGSARIPLHEMVKIDYLYGANWSLWLDVKVILRTVPYVLSRRGV